MELQLARGPSDDGGTFGRLLIENVPYSYTLEPQVREVPQLPTESDADWVARWKVFGRSAVPARKYRVLLLQSPRFGRRLMPHLADVPGFDSIMIHPLNVVSETEGCIGVGIGRGTLAGNPAILDSVKAFDPLLQRIKDCVARDEPVTIDILPFQPMYREGSGGVDIDAVMGG